MNVISFNSGLGAYDKAVVIGENGEIIGKQFKTFQPEAKNKWLLPLCSSIWIILSFVVLCINEITGFEFCFGRVFESDFLKRNII